MPFFPLPSPGGIFGPLYLCTAGVLLIAYDLIRMYRKPRHEQQPAWYERPLLWLGGSGIAIGLAVLAETKIASLPDTWPTFVFLLGFFPISLLSSLCCIITLGLSSSKRKALSKKARARSLFDRASVLENPLLTAMRMSLLACVALCLMAIWWACGLLFHLTPNQLFNSYGVSGLALVAVWCINRTFAQLRHLKRIEHLRVELTERNRPATAPFAPNFSYQQPAPPPILLRLTWQAMTGWVAFGLALGTLMASSLISTYKLPFLFLLAIKLPIILLVSAPIFVILLKLRSKVEATPYGLTSVQGIHTKRISWQEARLFVCYQIPGFFFGSKTTVIYELSGPDLLVQWTRVIDARSPFAVWQPVLPTDEYQRQTQQLCDLITTNTDLQLRDLSEAEPIVQFQACD